MTDLAAIVARTGDSLSASDLSTPGGGLTYEPLIRGYWQAIADRRALLALLRETRDALASVAEDHGCVSYHANSGNSPRPPRRPRYRGSGMSRLPIPDSRQPVQVWGERIATGLACFLIGFVLILAAIR